jgi:hypothetical protein
MIYAQLNHDNICIGLSVLTGETNDSKLVEIPEYSESYLWKKYENGIWSDIKYIPGTVVLKKDEIELLMSAITQQEAIIRTQNDQKLARLEEQNLILMDALATTFEEVMALRAIVEGGTAE